MNIYDQHQRSAVKSLSLFEGDFLDFGFNNFCFFGKTDCSFKVDFRLFSVLDTAVLETFFFFFFDILVGFSNLQSSLFSSEDSVNLSKYFSATQCNFKYYTNQHQFILYMFIQF